MSATPKEKDWAARDVIESAVTVPVVSVNLTSLHNAGLCEKKIVAHMRTTGIDIRETGVCSAVEIRPLSYQSHNPDFWGRQLMREVRVNWDKLKR